MKVISAAPGVAESQILLKETMMTKNSTAEDGALDILRCMFDLKVVTGSTHALRFLSD